MNCDVISHKIFFLSISTSSLPNFFSKMKLAKSSLRTQLKQTNLENRLRISTESPKKDFNNTVFQHFVYDFNNCKPDVRTDLQIVPVLLGWYSIYLVVMLNFTMIFLHHVFCFISFPHAFTIF